MRIWIASASALLMAAACSASKDATAALAAMNLQEGSSSPIVKYQGKSGSGDTVTLKDVVLGPGDGNGIKAASMALGGLDMTEGGKPVVTSITLKGITPEQALPAGMKFNLSSIAIEGLNAVAGEYVASAFATNSPGAPPPLEQWAFSKISINGMTFTSDGSPQMPGKVNIALGELSVSDLKNTVFGNTHLSGLKGDFDVPPEAAGFPIKGAFDFGTSDIKNVRGKLFETAIAAGIASATDPTAAAGINTKMMEVLGSPIDPGYDTFAWSGMNIDASGAKLAISKVDQKVTRNDKGIATAISSPRTTITFTADSAGGAIGQQATMGLALVGYPSSTIELYGEGDATYDPATDTTRYVKSNFGLTDGIDIKMTGGLQGLTAALGYLLDMADSLEHSVTSPADLGDGTAPPPGPSQPNMDALLKLKIVDLDLTITDKTLVNFVLGVAAMGSGGDVEKLRTDVVSQINALAGAVPPEAVETAVATEFSSAMAAFMKQPGSLNIKLKPAQPIALGEMGAAGPVTKQQLGFSASFTPSPTPPPKPAQ